MVFTGHLVQGVPGYIFNNQFFPFNSTVAINSRNPNIITTSAVNDPYVKIKINNTLKESSFYCTESTLKML